jgi:hypothetical protein
MSANLVSGPRSPEQRLNQPPTDQPWVWQSRALRKSDAWRSAGINARRFIDFLFLEHMKHGGQANGLLQAPHRQLVEFGIGARYVAEAIHDAEELCLVDGAHRGQRAAATYALTWLPLHGGTPATDRWQTYHNPDLKPLSAPKSRVLPSKGKAGLPRKGKADSTNLPIKGRADLEICLPKGRQNLPSHGKAPYISSYQGGDDCSVLEGGQSVSGMGLLSVPEQCHPLARTDGTPQADQGPDRVTPLRGHKRRIVL